MRRKGWAVCLGALLLGGVVAPAAAQAPVEVWGELEASVVSRRLPNDDKHELQYQSLAHTHLSSYLWRPWLATLNADLDVMFEGNPSGNYSEATSVAGNFVLSGLPASRFPFELFFFSSDNRFEGDYSGLDYSRMRAGVSGRGIYSDRSSLDYLFSHDQIDRSRYGNLAAQRAEVGLRHNFEPGELRFNITDVGLLLNYYNTDFKSARSGEPGYSSESLAGTFYYRSEPMERVNQDFSATLLSDNFGNKQDRFDRRIGQGVGTLQWRSPSNDFVATSALRMMVQQIDHRFAQERSDTDSALMAASAGVSWRASERLSMNLGARATAEHVQTINDETIAAQPDPLRSNFGGGLLGSIDYRSLAKEWRGFNWHWDARAAGDLGYDRNRYSLQRYEAMYGPRSDASATIGHTIGRSISMPWIDAVRVSMLQEVGFAHYSYAEEFMPIVTHSASLTKGYGDEWGSSYFRLHLRDTRSFGERPIEYQIGQADLTRHVQFSGNQRLQGTLGVQFVHQQRDDRDEVYAFARADLEYEYRDLFSVDGLSFTSTLRINALGQNDLGYDWRDQLHPELFRNDWRNRLLYRVGKLSLALEGTIFEVDDQLGYLVRASGRRTFDFVD